MRRVLGVVVLVAVWALPAAGQSSSLLKSGKTAPPPVVNAQGEEIVTSEEATVANTSLVAVRKPPPRKFAVHDIVTIVVREESTSKSEADGSAEKSFELSADLKEWLKFHDDGTLRIIPDEGIAALNPKIDVSMDRNYEGEGEATTKDSFLTKIAAEVIDVKPNGNLTLEAKRSIVHNDERITMTLTGMVRPADVAVDNTVTSSCVANLAVAKQTQGIARDGQKRGWLVRLLEAINPF